MALRWGIASAGKISSDFVNAVGTLPAEDHKVVAVAARSFSSAQEFAEKFDIPKAYEGYIKLAEDKDIEVVYVGTLNPQHFEVTKLMLEHGKHVLCEKPFTMNEKQTRQLIQIAETKKLFLMEGVWSRCFPVYTELQKQINSGAIGEIKHVHASFGFHLEVDRLRKKELGGGGILDLGVYVLQFQQFVYRGLTPTKIVAAGHLNEFGTDDTSELILIYPDGQTATGSTSTRFELPNEAVVVGTKGIIKIPTFWCPTEIILPGNKKLTFELPKGSKYDYNFGNSEALSYEAEEVRQCIKNGRLESDKITHAETLTLAKYLDSVRKDVGVVFPEDEE